MTASTGKTSQQLLDGVQGRAHLDGFEPGAYTRRLDEELGPVEPTLAGLEARDDQLRAALAAIDGFASRAMRIRLDHVLADDTAVATPFRKVLAGTVLSYEGRLDVLGERVASAAGRADPGGASATAAVVVEAAERVIALRAELHGGVLALGQASAAAALPAVRELARDRSADDKVRARWVLVRRDLELLIERPDRLADEGFTARLKALPPLEEPAEEVREYTRGELLEYD